MLRRWDHRQRERIDWTGWRGGIQHATRGNRTRAIVVGMVFDRCAGRCFGVARQRGAQQQRCEPLRQAAMKWDGIMHALNMHATGGFPLEREVSDREHWRERAACYGFNLPIMRGNGITSRMCSMPQIQAMVRSSPNPKPECVKVPYLRSAKYQS